MTDHRDKIHTRAYQIIGAAGVPNPNEQARKVAYTAADRELTNERSNAFRMLLAVLAGLILGLMVNGAQAQTHQEWARLDGVKYDHTNSPYTVQHVEQAIEESVWSWASRIPQLELNYVGLTLAPIERAVITYRWLGVAEYLELNPNLLSQAFERRWIYIDNGMIAQSVIYMNTTYFSGGIDACERMIISHELGHALGIVGHSPDPDDLMYEAPSHCHYVPTDNDIKIAGYEPSTCHTVLTQEHDLYVPDVQGQAAMLKRIGDTTWGLEHVAPNPHSRGCSDTWVDDTGVIHMNDVRGREAQFSRVELAPVSDNTWTLRWAE